MANIGAELSNDIRQMQDLLRLIVDDGNLLGTFDSAPVVKINLNANIKKLMQLTNTTKSRIVELRKASDPTVDQYEEEFKKIGAQMKKDLPPIIQKLREEESARDSSPQVSIINEPLLQDQQQIDAMTDQIDTLEEAVREILSTMNQLNEIFRQTLEELQKQRYVIATIDEHVESAHNDMKGGNKNLETAQEHQKSSTKCLWWIVAIILVVVGGVVAFLVVKYA